ncbi:MFS transporter [candidate division WWE3 bacterium]|jgi:MFS family permease|uniref:MFS transporter n=1 Tax=candidate division WWE3 bacterium TaxID=2053526 RepID=A0A3A4ZBE6_UNCKA|nr:MAG: MFS transporter [candidate division WWE3 bacterium]
MNIISRVFPYHHFRISNKAIKILTLSDTLFFSGMALVEIIFGVFIVQNIPGATVVELGIGHSIFLVGIVLTEPLFSKFYDSAKNLESSYYGFVIGNLLKSVMRLLFIVIDSVPMFYIVYFIMGIIHSIEYPSFAKLFTKHLDSGRESSEWGYKDSLMSTGKVLTTFLSGYIVVSLGYQFLFLLSSLIMLIFGVLTPLYYKKEILG